jgi:hypothetical protein
VTGSDLGEHYVPELTEERIPESSEERIRVLICRSCNTVAPMPWYDGPVYQDYRLHFQLAGHKTSPDGPPHQGALATVGKKRWEDPVGHAEILKDFGISW